MNRERLRIWYRQSKKWLIPAICLILGGLLGGTFEYIEHESTPVEVEVYVDDESL